MVEINLRNTAANLARYGADGAGMLATRILERNGPAARRDVEAIGRDLQALKEADPRLAADVRAAVEPRLTSVQRGELARLDSQPCGTTVAVRASNGGDWKGTALDLTQIGLDIVGIFEPTPFADGSNAIISAFRGNWGDAALSVAGIIPYAGDLAKLGKLGGWANKVANAVDLAMSNPAARQALEPALRKIKDAIDAAPDAVMRGLPAGARESIERMSTKLDELYGGATRAIDAGVVRAAERLGLPPAKVQEIIDVGRGNRPPVASYMSPAAQAAHLARFDDGIVRFTSRSGAASYGTLGPPGGFVMPASEFRRVMDEAKGNLSVVEDRLGLTRGTLKSDDTLIAFVARKDATGLRVPSGNEGGANDNWLPGGITSGGVGEAVMDFGKSTPYREIKLP